MDRDGRRETKRETEHLQARVLDTVASQRLDILEENVLRTVYQISGQHQDIL